MLIRNAEIEGNRIADVRIRDGRIAGIGVALEAADEQVIDADGGALLPGLHDHHLHLNAFAAALQSVACGPPDVQSAGRLRDVLRAASNRLPPGDWLRGVGYHESVAGQIDRDWLDDAVSDRPVRIQHRSGRLWIVNSRGLSALGPRGLNDDPFEKANGHPTGRLYDSDAWLRSRAGGNAPSLVVASRELARWGVTGVTDTTPDNGFAAWERFDAAQQAGELLQRVRVMGGAELDRAVDSTCLQRGERKFHLHDAELPGFEETCGQIRAAHRAGRACAFHCVTRGDLAFALATLRESGVRAGDRIEHASIAPPDLVGQMSALGLTVVTQPNFIRERGDRYLQEVDRDDLDWLYRLRGFLRAGISLAAGTDAPFGHANPWAAMQAAVSRETRDGRVMGAEESLTPEQALALFTGEPPWPGRARRIAEGQPADLCLLSAAWSQARSALADTHVRMTLRAGRVIWGVVEETAVTS